VDTIGIGVCAERRLTLCTRRCIRGLRDVPHPNIIAFHTFIITPSYALITMAHHPRCIPVALPEEKAAGYFRQLISAVDYLHAHGEFQGLERLAV